MARTVDIEIRGSGSSWSVFHQGQQLGKPQNQYEKACISAGVWQRRLSARDRACLCCGAQFSSYGIGHRMCDACREDARGAMV
ncbi:hypothetical protein [Paenirhodobacter sp. CAU 1674]|uniref:hypothetical protein n=1 Tax=Paenirhodobacter sp. CAU 1674 TaxID=3032596 RepID=UPI0023DB7170|nr:hypothetical protein [Paenirhodobacter sp. CAU 1674]MDF2143238.1 hypothetical protein [Paenirhodobacter sp. CAU 1674]